MSDTPAPAPTPRASEVIDTFRRTAGSLSVRLHEAAIVMERRLDALDIAGSKLAVVLAAEADELGAALRYANTRAGEERARLRAGLATRVIDLQRDAESLLARIPKTATRDS